MERKPIGRFDAETMFGGIQPSRQAIGLAWKAISLGEDPTALTLQAGIAAQRDGRRKVGFFGEAGKYLSGLKIVVDSIERGNAMTESARRTRKTGNY
jgi:hypothetical protein